MTLVLIPAKVKSSTTLRWELLCCSHGRWACCPQAISALEVQRLFHLFLSPPRSKRKRTELTATYFSTGPAGACIGLLAPAHSVRPLISSLRPAWRDTSTRPRGTGTIPCGKEEKTIWKERVKPGGEVLVECKSVRLASNPRLSLQPTRCIYQHKMNVSIPV